jgi:hypothetical protein
LGTPTVNGNFAIALIEADYPISSPRDPALYVFDAGMSASLWMGMEKTDDISLVFFCLEEGGNPILRVKRESVDRRG